MYAMREAMQEAAAKIKCKAQVNQDAQDFTRALLINSEGTPIYTAYDPSGLFGFVQAVSHCMALNEYRQEVRFPLKHLCKLAVALNVSVYDFFTYVSPEQVGKAYKRRQPEVMAKYKDIIELKKSMTYKQLSEHYGISEGRACSIYKNRCLNMQNTEYK